MITIHCADTPNGKPFHNTDIDGWHKERGFKRSAKCMQAYNPQLGFIGYHFVICVDGQVETGRMVGEVGAHVAGHNTDNIGICLIGKDQFTKAQWDALRFLLLQLLGMEEQEVKGHYQFDTAIQQGKLCPNFNVPLYMESMTPQEEHIFRG